ncbi:hypothetical protein GGR58DRAFT_474149 [Xylaria digitata]|nr:hypothetical protein GGR58DRAFT_474149 [Xylaria digitata]
MGGRGFGIMACKLSSLYSAATAGFIPILSGDCHSHPSFDGIPEASSVAIRFYYSPLVLPLPYDVERTVRSSLIW